MPNARLATEQYSIDDARRCLPEARAHLDKILTRLQRLRPLPEAARFLDVGSAHGALLIACARKGLDAIGIEPWESARSVAWELAAAEGVPINVVAGVAEQLPLPEESFDIVHSNAVFEHVLGPRAMLAECYRVLRPGGVFWFSSASAMCPRQHEITRFPFFGWYPDRLKRRIMAWAKDRRPHLIGHTETPAVNWLTPGRAKRMLHEAGFSGVRDQWQIRLPEEGGRGHALAVRFIRATWPTRRLADMMTPACSFAAVKDRVPSTG